MKEYTFMVGPIMSKQALKKKKKKKQQQQQQQQQQHCTLQSCGVVGLLPH